MCHNVNVEPALQPLSGEVLTGVSAIRDDAARLDIAADGFWGITVRECSVTFEFSILKLLLITNLCQPATASKRAYEQRVREVEHGSFTPLVFSASGGMGNAAKIFYKRLASMIAEKSGSPYSTPYSRLDEDSSVFLPASLSNPMYSGDQVLKKESRSW